MNENYKCLNQNCTVEYYYSDTNGFCPGCEYRGQVVCRCQECGCEGSLSCSHDWLDEEKLCTLDEWLVCPCCNIDPKHMVIGEIGQKLLNILE